MAARLAPGPALGLTVREALLCAVARKRGDGHAVAEPGPSLSGVQTRGPLRSPSRARRLQVCYSVLDVARIRVVSCAGVLVAALSGCTASPDKAVSDTSAADSVATTDATDPAAAEDQAAAPEKSESPPAKPPPPSRTTNLPLGQTLIATGQDGSSLQVQAVQTKASREAPDQYSAPPVKGVFLGVLIQYVCKTGPCAYNPYDFVMRGADGAEYNQAFASEGFEPTLHSGTLTSGVPAKGYIVYDLAPGTYSLEYRANIADNEAASWVIPVTSSTDAGSMAAPSVAFSTPAFMVIVASKTDAEGGRAAAQTVAERLTKAGRPTFVLSSSDYSSLRPGYWVAATGPFQNADGAARAAEQLKREGFDIAYTRCVGTAAECR